MHKKNTKQQNQGIQVQRYYTIYSRYCFHSNRRISQVCSFHYKVHESNHCFIEVSILSHYELRAKFDNLNLPNEDRSMLKILVSY